MGLGAELLYVISDYLCSECKAPWYAKLGTENEYCFNPACRICDRSHTFPTDVTSAEPLTTETKQEEGRFLGNLRRWKKGKLLEFAYQARNTLIQELWKTGRVNIGDILILDDLLVRVQLATTGTESPNQAAFGRLLSQFESYRSKVTMIEGISYGRFLVSTSTGETFVLKYWIAMQEMFRNFGLINPESKELEGTFRYQDVDTEAKQRRPPGQFDYGAYFESMFDFCSTLRYGFEMQDSDRLRHNYDPATSELATLLALAGSCRRLVETQPPGWLEYHLRNNGITGSEASRFVEKYVLGQSLAPIAIQIDGRTRFDWFTIIFYSHYLITKNQVRSPFATDTGANRMNKAKGRASEIFDERLRVFLTNLGYKVAPKPVRVKFGEDSREYDVLGCNESKRTLVLIEAKYRDITSSSFSKDRLVQQELLGDDGVVAWAVGQQERLDLMPANPERFVEVLKLEQKVTDYKRVAFVITKFAPLISKYKDVRILSYPGFCQVSGL